MPQPAPHTDTASAEFSSTDFRAALGTFATGVTVITTKGEGHPYGMTANAFSSVSLDPPLVLVCVVEGTRGGDEIQQNGVFAVNILAEHQEPISRFFASRERSSGQDAFAEIAHRAVATGSPILESTAGFLDCRLHATHEAGDHMIIIGEVLALGADPEVRPLLFHCGRYRFATG